MQRLTPSNDLLIRQIDHQNVNQNNPISRSHPIHDHPEYSFHQHRVPIFHSGRTSTLHQHHQIVQSIGAPRRLTRIPMDSTIEEELAPRTSTNIEWQRSSSIGDYLNKRS